MKTLFFLFFIIVISTTLSAQCYIQYTYDSSGNRIKREYVGGCAHPGPSDDQIPAADTLQSLAIESRSELIRLDMEARIKVYPNPTDGYLNVRLDSPHQNWTYRLSTLAGQLIHQADIVQQEFFIDIGHLPSAPYIFVICDTTDVVVYKTQIIKQ